MPWQFLLMTAMRYGLKEAQVQSLYVLPFREQLNMGLPQAAHSYYGLQTYYFLAVIFLLTALASIPVGQLWGALMERRSKLVGYGLNLLGSLAGILLIFVVSAFGHRPSCLAYSISSTVTACRFVLDLAMFGLQLVAKAFQRK